jgi:hypothetical protein
VDAERADEHMVTALREIAARRDALFGSGSAEGWFDGFWDFFVPERANLTGARAWWAAGPGWYVLYWHRPTDGGEDGAIERRLDVFVESKDYRPNAIAPWPVTSIELGTGRKLAPTPLRHGDPERIAELGALGCSARVSYWGPHATCLDVARMRELDVARVLDAALGLVGL